MSEPIKIGYICEKSGGHAVFYGMEDSCGSHDTADIVIVPTGGNGREIDYAKVAKDLADWLARLERDAEKWRWAQYDASMAGDNGR
jgi:hypothetical protein